VGLSPPPPGGGGGGGGGGGHRPRVNLTTVRWRPHMQSGWRRVLPEQGGQEQAGRPLRVHPVCLLQHLLPQLLVERGQVPGARRPTTGVPVHFDTNQCL